MALSLPVSKDLRKLLAFGSGVGIEICGADLEVVAARVRPSTVQVLGRLVIHNFAERPAAEWGAEYTRFLKSAGLGHLSATVLLPRREVIVRQVALPGVAAKDIEGAIRLQLDTLHPYGDDEVAWGWSPLAYGSVLVGIVRRSAVDRYHRLFTEADIAVASFTFSAAALHAAVRLNGHSDGPGFLALSHTVAGAIEAYGESAARPVFSAEFDLAPERAAVLALSELRLPPETVPLKLEEVLPRPAINPVENDLSRNALPYATALAGACPRFAPAANVLPPEQRRLRSRAVFLPTLVLAGLLMLVLVGMAAYSAYSDRRYLQKLDAEIATLQPVAQRAAALDRRIADTQARIRLLDQFRSETHRDLDTLKELTRLVEPPAWTSATTLTHEMVRISGQAPQASPLIRILDSSSFFADSTPESIQRSPTGTGELFTIHMNRRPAR